MKWIGGCMKICIANSLLPSVALLLSSVHANAEKVVGTCKVDVAGPHSFTINGKLYEGKVPDNIHQSYASTHSWARKWAEEYRPHSSSMADLKLKTANELSGSIRIVCESEKGKVQLMPYDGTA